MLVAGQSQSHKTELPASTKIAKPGGLLPRLIALIVDSLILLVILFPIMSLWASQLAPARLDAGASHSTIDTLRGSLSLQLTLILLQVFYFAGSWTIMAATPGQLLMSLRVTDANAAGIGFMRALFRYVLFSLFLVLAPVSALMVAVGKQKRALHDLLAGTYVIQVMDRDDFGLEGGLPASSSGDQETVAPAPGPRIPPDPSPAPAAPAVGGAAYSPPRSRAAYSPPASVPLPGASPGPAATVPPPPSAAPPQDFPPMPLGTSADVPPPPGRRASGGGLDADLYAPPPMVDPSAPPPGAADSTDGGTAPQHDLPPMEFPPMAPPPDHHK